MELKFVSFVFLKQNVRGLCNRLRHSPEVLPPIGVADLLGLLHFATVSMAMLQ